METNANFRFVGWVVGVLLTATIAFTVWLIDPQPDRVKYQVRFDQSVDGLQPGSAVTLSGVPVGTVDAVILEVDDPEAVYVTFSLDPAGAKAPGLEASIARNLITGEADLVLDSERGRRGIFIDSAGVRNIPSASGGGMFGGDARGTLENLAKGVDNLADSLDPDKQSAISDKLGRVRRKTAELASESREFASGTGRTRRDIEDYGRKAKNWGKVAQSADQRLSNGDFAVGAENSLAKANEEITAAGAGIAGVRRKIPGIRKSLTDAEDAAKTLRTGIEPIGRRLGDVERNGISSSQPTPEFRKPSTDASKEACDGSPGC